MKTIMPGERDDSQDDYDAMDRVYKRRSAARRSRVGWKNSERLAPERVAVRQPVVMISSTVRDLPEHRMAVMDACLRQGMYPLMMEHMPASDSAAMSESLSLVERADIYLGIFGHRYGTVPKGQRVSVTEMEYGRSTELGITRLIFIMHDDHPVLARDVEMGAGAALLEDFKARLQSSHIVSFFRSAAELRTQVIDALSRLRRPVSGIHSDGDIPKAPLPYVAHPYALGCTRDLVGRTAELERLNQWGASAAKDADKLSVIFAPGGAGKSALAWKWFNSVVPNYAVPLAGRIWWSFYESDASFDNFVVRSLAYLKNSGVEGVQQLSPGEREAELLTYLDQQPVLVVLDGLERILLAYASADSTRLREEQVTGGLSNCRASIDAYVTSNSDHRLRRTTDPQAGVFLRRLLKVRNSRTLICTRLFPADLEGPSTDPLPGCSKLELSGLDDIDALRLWQELSGSKKEGGVLRLLQKCANHPLVIQVLAGEVAHFRAAPGDFEQWRRSNPRFDPFSLPLTEVRNHVLSSAMGGLGELERCVLDLLSGFRMPATYDAILSLVTREETLLKEPHELDKVLTSLEDRGLLGWDRKRNRYDLHPVVRGVVWGSLNETAKSRIYADLYDHFYTCPSADCEAANCIEDLTAEIELYNILMGLGRYEEAVHHLRYEMDELVRVLLDRLYAAKELAGMLEQFFPDGLENDPCAPGSEGYILTTLGKTYLSCGLPKKASELLRRSGRFGWNGALLLDLATACRQCGRIRESEFAARGALKLAQYSRSKAMDLRALGETLLLMGKLDEATDALQTSLSLTGKDYWDDISAVNIDLAFLMLRKRELQRAHECAKIAAEAATHAHWHHQLVLSKVDRLRAGLAVADGDLGGAEQYLQSCLRRSRTARIVDEELAATIGLAEVKRCQSDLSSAIDLLDNVWEFANRGFYPICIAEANLVLADVKQDYGDADGFAEATYSAYRAAWCDGPPFCYYWGLESARQRLAMASLQEPKDLAASESVAYPWM